MPNIILLDLENVQPKNLEPLRQTDDLIRVFLGSSQKKLALEFVKLLQPFGPRVEFIEIDGSGPNALDFHIAYYVGRLACEAPGQPILIISRDTGFDPLIRHVRKTGVDCKRSDGVQTAQPKPVPKKAATPVIVHPPSLDEQVERVRANFAKRPNRPRTIKTLRSTLAALFQKQLSVVAIDTLIASLIRCGFVSDVEGKAVYS